MLVIIIISTLITIITLIVSAAIYLLSLVVEGSDDESISEVLTIDARDFSNTPSTSPASVPTCDVPGHHHHNDEVVETNQEISIGSTLPLGQKLEALVNASGVNNLINEEAPPVINDDKFSTPNPTPVSSVSNSDSRADDTSSIGSNDHQQHQQDGTTNKLPTDIWTQLPTAQKNALTNLLGPTVSKLMFDDFDPKEMQLGGTGLHWCKSRKTLDKLIKLGQPLNSTNKRHETPLHVAVRKHNLPVMIGLLCYGASVDCKSDKGETPLLLSCKVNDIFACQVLLVFDSDVNSKDKRGLSARHYAARLCNKHKIHQDQPSAAHLILAMLNEMNAKRCEKPLSKSQTTSMNNHPAPTTNAATSGSKIPTPVKPALATSYECADGCTHSGSYNGNSFDRWSSFERESLYKRHMFADLIGSCLNRKSSSSSQSSTISDSKVKQSRMLCIDGGGMRGVLVCQLMIEMEKYLKRPMISYFDWIGGTSVGAFLACALVCGTTLKELRRICFDVKDEVFSGSKPYNSKHLERVLKRTYGTSKRLSDIKGRRLAVTTVLADRDPCQLKLFRNYKSPAQVLEQYGYPPSKYDTMSGQAVVRPAPIPSLKSTLNAIAPTVATQPSSSAAQQPAIKAVTAITGKSTSGKSVQGQVLSRRTSAESSLTSSASSEPAIDENEKDPLMWQAVRASAAAPFFFRPYGPYLDGGIISNNPTLDLMSEFYSCEQVRKFISQRCVKSDPIHALPREKLELVVSLGTGRGRIVGQQAMIDFGNVATGLATVFSPVELVKSIRAARDMFKKLMHRSCMTDDHILDRAQAWCASLNIPYFRLNPPLASIFSIDDKRDEQLINALWQVKLYCKALKLQMHQLGDLLDEKS